MWSQELLAGFWLCQWLPSDRGQALPSREEGAGIGQC